MTRKTSFFEGCSWVKFNNFGLALGMGLTFYANVAKGLKLKVRKFWELICTFVEVIGEKLVGSLFAPLSWIGICKNYVSCIFPKHCYTFFCIMYQIEPILCKMFPAIFLFCIQILVYYVWRSVLGPDVLSLSSRWERLLTKLYLSTIRRWFY